MLGAGGLAAAGLLAQYQFRGRTKAKPEPTPSTDQQQLAAIIDTLIPADEFPGALDIGLDQRLFDLISSDAKWKTRADIVRDAVQQRTLRTKRRAFYELPQEDREEVLFDIWRENTPRKREFGRLRSIIMDWFYTSPEGRQSVNYQLPAHYPAYRT